MARLKSYVRNTSRPEGSMAEGYIADECATFCSRYLRKDDTLINQPLMAEGDQGCEIGCSVMCQIETTDLEKAHRWILFHNEEVQPYIEYDYFFPLVTFVYVY